jgi:hypothetical protein
MPRQVFIRSRETKTMGTFGEGVLCVVGIMAAAAVPANDQEQLVERTVVTNPKAMRKQTTIRLFVDNICLLLFIEHSFVLLG